MAIDIYNRLAQTARSLSIGNPWAGNGETAPRPGRARVFEALLMTRPRPLVDPDARLIVLFSPKAACTNVTVWFLNQIGHIKAARDFSNWPHKYRLKVYYDSALYRKARGLNLKKFKVIRVIRDPYDRTTSGFRHAVKTKKTGTEIAQELGLSEIATQ
ncbi:MAG TPA: sulfotransferase family 2 domain-containing protein, partial [Burkholderiales bacterium]|nr:sulfotransferase family 2 domain-containing protein [Burkholderiales bacterium]